LIFNNFFQIEHFQREECALEHVPKKLLDFLDQNMLQLFESERFFSIRGFHLIGKRSDQGRFKFDRAWALFICFAA